MGLVGAFLWFVARVVPASSRQRWLEEWRAELAHGRWTMVFGAPRDAWALRSQSAGRGQVTALPLWHAFPQDVRYALRGLLASPGFAAAVVLSLSVGIGANVVAFSLINAIMFRPFDGITDQHELVTIAPRATDARTGYPAGLGAAGVDREVRPDALAAAFTTLLDVSAQREVKLASLVNGQAATTPGALVSSNYFAVLGVRPVAGRVFQAHEDSAGAHPVVIISDLAWERWFARDRKAIGRTISVNGALLEIVGIAPPNFTGARRSADMDRRPDLWIPLGMASLTLRDSRGRPAPLDTARDYRFEYIGRQRPGVSLDTVQAEGAVLAARLKLSGSDKFTYRVDVSRVWQMDPMEAAPQLVAFMVIPLLVLAIACVNAANLMLARSARQLRDWTVRLAIGASRWRVVRQVLTEATLLTAAAATLGLVLARWATDLITRYVPIGVPLDVRVALFAVVIAGITALSFSLGPALGLVARAGRRLSPTTGSAGSTRSRLRFALVAAQAALSLGLLVTGTQFTRTAFQDNPNTAAIPDTHTLVLASFDLDPLRLPPEAGEEFYSGLLARVRSLPGVTAAGLSTSGMVRGAFYGSGRRMWGPNSPPQGEGVLSFQVTPGALDAIGVPMAAGRRFSEVDAQQLQSVIVNQPFARQFFGGAALGRTFRLAPGNGAATTGTEVTIVGVVDGIMKRTDQEGPIVYAPAPLAYEFTRALYVRIDNSGAFSAATLQAAVRDVDPRVPIGELQTLRESLDSRNVEYKWLATGAAWLGLAALILAAAGLYSVVAYVVSLRRQEVGIRLALGAAPGTIVTMIVRQALMPTLVGTLVGAVGAAVAGALIRSRLHGTTPVDPLAFAAAGVMMVLVMALASWIPARQAGRVDPLQVLRTE